MSDMPPFFEGLTQMVKAGYDAFCLSPYGSASLDIPDHTRRCYPYVLDKREPLTIERMRSLGQAIGDLHPYCLTFVVKVTYDRVYLIPTY